MSTAPTAGLVSSTRIGWKSGFLVCALGLGAWPVAALAQLPGTDIPRHVAFFLVSFVFYLVAVVLVIVRDDSPPRGSLYLALAWAVLLRLALLAIPPSLSDDVFRYVWDGKVASAGIDPYAYPPAAPELESLRTPLWNGINHKSMATPYPPLAEVLFAMVFRLAPDSLTAMQAAAVLLDLGVVVVLWMLLGRLGMDRRRVLIYAWNPLVMVQFAHSAHFDAAMLLPLLGSILLLAVPSVGAFHARQSAWLASRRSLRNLFAALSGIALGLSVLIKLVPAMLGPLFLPPWGVFGAVAAAATIAFGTLPFIGSAALSGVLSEASDARFNDSIGYVVLRAFSMVTADADALARSACTSALVITSLWVAFSLWRSRAGWTALPEAIYTVTGAFLLLNAVVEPWYFTWILPFLCFVLPSGQIARFWLSPSWGWLLLTGSVVLTDLTYVPSFGNSSWVWIRAAEYGPLFVLLAVWLFRRRACELPSRPVRSD